MNEISDLEITETKAILMNYFNNSEINTLVELSNDTIGTLRRLKIKILDRIDSFRLGQLERSIKTLVRNLLRKPKRAFKNYSNCLACKTALRIILYASASVLGIAISAINTRFSDIATLLSTFFEESITSIKSFLTNYGFQIAAFNLFDINDLIEKLCEEYGFC